MKEYLILQYKMANRKLNEVGIHPAIGYTLGIVCFILIADYAFQKTEFAKYLVLLIALSILSSLSERDRNEFLLTVFSNKMTRKIRVTENLIICLPFMVLLLYHHAFLALILLFVASIFMAVISFKSNFNFTIPTPFYKDPFEFTVGFRKSFYMFPIAYILTFIAISVDNMNLGIFAMLLVFLVSISYCAKPEREYYVWIYANNSKGFLLKKLKTATKQSFLLVSPIVSILLIFYPNEIGLILVFLFIGLLFLWAIILAKYSAYPNEISLPEGILIAFCIYFPPILLVLIPFFYKKSVNNLNVLLR